MEIRSTLADIEAVVSVIGLIISDYPVIQQLALNLCSILCLEQSSCDQLVANDGLNKLLLFVENQGKSVHFIIRIIKLMLANFSSSDWLTLSIPQLEILN